MIRDRIPLIGVLLGAAGVGGCTTVRSVPPSEYLADHNPPIVVVTYTNNTVVSIREPEVRRDTLRGTLQGARIKIPLSEIQSVQASVRDRTKTALLLSTMGVAAASSIYFMWISKSGPEGITIDCANDAVEEHPEEHPECQN
jgi:hypothetical protein